MITVCIPVYNFFIGSLYTTLLKQIEQLSVPCQLLVIDDASDNNIRDTNQHIVGNKNYIQLTQNIGRAGIRNLFLQYAAFDHLLFLDCDSLLIRQNFLTNYITFIQQHPRYGVVCGGRVYENHLPERKYRLRWWYGVLRESVSSGKRSLHPYRSFMTNNFLVQKDVLQTFPFDERIREYGHEDTLFGYTLQKNGVPVHHIGNPVLNGHLEENSVYLRKTEKAVKNLVNIVSFVNNDPLFTNNVKLLRIYGKIKPVQSIIKPFLRLCLPLIRRRLAKGNVSLTLFDLFKLAVLLQSQRTGKKLTVVF